MDAFAKHLDEYKVKYGNWAGSSKEPQVRPDKVKQYTCRTPTVLDRDQRRYVLSRKRG